MNTLMYVKNRALSPTHQRRHTGFTLMELLIAIAILAILTTIALPSFRIALQSNRLVGQTNELVAAFQYARSEALRHATPVRVCPTTDGTSCGGGWNGRWIAICSQDPNCLGTDDSLLRVWPAPSDDFLINVSGGLNGSGQIEFNPEGCLGTDFCSFDPNNQEILVSVTIQDNILDTSLRCIQISPLGRTSVWRPVDSADLANNPC